jgi:hypothetical protein
MGGRRRGLLLDMTMLYSARGRGGESEWGAVRSREERSRAARLPSKPLASPGAPALRC